MNALDLRRSAGFARSMEYVNMLIALVIVVAAWRLTVELLDWYGHRVHHRVSGRRHAD